MEAGSIVIATGSAPFVPDQFAQLGERVLTNASIFDLEGLPARLAVIGSGPIGLELAQAMARLGVEVSLFDQGRRLGGVRCDKVHAALSEIIQSDLSLVMGVDIKACTTDNGIRLEWNGDSSGTADFDYVLVATGRRPNFTSLNLAAADLQLDDSGVPLHDRETMRCGDSAIFLAGDVADDLPVLHEASHEGAIAGLNAAAFPASIRSDRFTSFRLTFTSPPVARSAPDL